MRNFIFLLLAIFTFGKGFTQVNVFDLQEKTFANLYLKLLSNVQVDEDSTFLYSEKFSKGFTSFIKNNPGTLDYPFKKLIDSNYSQIRTSGDGNFRIYSWDAWTGGTMHEFNEIYQWRGSGKCSQKNFNLFKRRPGSFCSAIFTIDINNKPYYLGVTNAIYSTKDARQSIAVYNIDDDKLIDTAKLFRTRTKRLNRIDVSFDFFSVADRSERPLELITYDDKHKVIYVPVVGNKGQVTTQNIIYQLKNNYFEYTGIETGTRK